MSDRRSFLKTASAAGLTTHLFPRLGRGANDKIQAAFIGMGRMGMGNLSAAMRQENLVPVAVCDVYQPHLEKAFEAASKNAHGAAVRKVKDFREILADKSIDIVCISTPDHWHAYMTVEACKAGKDVYVEKPISVTIEEGQLMVRAARKYNRVVQTGTQQRSQPHYQQLTKMIAEGAIGEVTFVRTGNYGYAPPEGIGNPPDEPPPPDLDWEMWLGPAPARPFNKNRFGVDPKTFSHFRWFWDYAGGMMTDWGVHVLDIVQMAFGETMPVSCVALGKKSYIRDNRDTPDTLEATYEYPKFLATYENRMGNEHPPFPYGNTAFHGTKGTLYCDRSGFKIVPTKQGGIEALEVQAERGGGNVQHWANFLECVKTRQRPVSDIEICHRSTATCHLANISLRAKCRVDFDAATWTVNPAEARKYVSRPARAPWKITL